MVSACSRATATSSAPWRRALSRKPFSPLSVRASPPGGAAGGPSSGSSAAVGSPGTARRRRVPAGCALMMIGLSATELGALRDELVLGALVGALDRDLAAVLETPHDGHDAALRLLDHAPAHRAHE